MSKLEHNVPENLEVVPIYDAVRLASDIASVNFNDEGETEGLLLEILSSLVAYDTRVLLNKAGEFVDAEDFVLSLLHRPIIEGNLHFRRVSAFTTSNDLHRNMIIVAPGELQEEVDNAVSNYESRIKTEQIIPIETDRVVLHFHLDTVMRRKDAGETHETLFDPQTGIAYGLGTNDMKGSGAAVILLYEKLLREGIDMPVLMITTDEENQGMWGGERFMKTFRSSTLNLDLEPTSCVPGTMVDEIGSAFSLIIDDIKLTGEQLEEIERNLFERFGYVFYPHVSYSAGDLRITLNPEGWDVTKKFMKKSLLSIAGKSIEGFIARFSERGSKRSSIDAKARFHVAMALLNNYKTLDYDKEAPPFTLLTRGYRKRLMFWDIPFSLLSDNFDTQVTIAHPYSKWGIIGPNESGGGRHSLQEGVCIRELRMLSSTLFEICKRLH